MFNAFMNVANKKTVYHACRRATGRLGHRCDPFELRRGKKQERILTDFSDLKILSPSGGLR